MPLIRTHVPSIVVSALARAMKPKLAIPNIASKTIVIAFLTFSHSNFPEIL
jgi:hypothetical protein